MVKIKQKKQLNLPQLIQWAWKNDIKNKEYQCDGFEDKTVIFNRMGWAEFSDKYSYNLTDFFTVEVEEVVDEDTELDLIERFIVDNETYYTNPRELSINTCLGAAPDDIIATHFYIENDERELVLIWRDGRLIE